MRNKARQLLFPEVLRKNGEAMHKSTVEAGLSSGLTATTSQTAKNGKLTFNMDTTEVRVGP